MKIQNHLKINKTVPIATNHVVSTIILIKNILYFRPSKKDKFSKKFKIVGRMGGPVTACLAVS
jgi:hypothetical protein